MPQDWPMASLLAPPPSTPPQDSTAPDGNSPDSQASTPGNDNPTRVESVPTTSTSQAPPESTNSGDGDGMQVDEPEATAPTLRRTTREIKPVNHTLMLQTVVPIPPSQKSKGKQRTKTSSNVKAATPHPRPLVIGDKYMKISFIDLTQVEVGIIHFYISSIALNTSPQRSSPTLKLSQTAVVYNPYFISSSDSLLFLSNARKKLLFTRMTPMDNHVSIRLTFMYVTPLCCHYPAKMFLLH